MIINKDLEKRLEKLLDTLEKTENYDFFVYNTNDVLNSYLRLRERLDNMISDYYGFKRELYKQLEMNRRELLHRNTEVKQIIKDNFTKLFELLEVKEKTNE